MNEIMQKLITRAREIENERKTAANTASRVGSLFVNIILFFNDLFAKKQDKTDEMIETTDKTVSGAINEVKRAVDGIEIPDVSGKQDKQDNALQTNDKTVVGAINELNNVGKVIKDIKTYENDSIIITYSDGTIRIIEHIVEITRNALLELKNNAGLDISKRYKIIDYVYSSQSGTPVSENPIMDLILRPTSENNFDVFVTPLLHVGSDYLKNCSFESWIVKYDIGKNEITYLKDEYNNEAYLDYKSARFRDSIYIPGQESKPLVDHPVFYTVIDNNIYDATIINDIVTSPTVLNVKTTTNNASRCHIGNCTDSSFVTWGNTVYDSHHIYELGTIGGGNNYINCSYIEHEQGGGCTYKNSSNIKMYIGGGVTVESSKNVTINSSGGGFVIKNSQDVKYLNVTGNPSINNCKNLDFECSIVTTSTSEGIVSCKDIKARNAVFGISSCEKISIVGDSVKNDGYAVSGSKVVYLKQVYNSKIDWSKNTGGDLNINYANDYDAEKSYYNLNIKSGGRISPTDYNKYTHVNYNEKSYYIRTASQQKRFPNSYNENADIVQSEPETIVLYNNNLHKQIIFSPLSGHLIWVLDYDYNSGTPTAGVKVTIDLNTGYTNYSANVLQGNSNENSFSTEPASDNWDYRQSNYVPASFSGAIGRENHVDSQCSLAIGRGLKVQNPNSLSIGQYNLKEDLLFSIGNGTSDDNRSTCFKVLSDGRVFLGENDLNTLLAGKLSYCKLPINSDLNSIALEGIYSGYSPDQALSNSPDTGEFTLIYTKPIVSVDSQSGDLQYMFGSTGRIYKRFKFPNVSEYEDWELVNGTTSTKTSLHSFEYICANHKGGGKVYSDIYGRIFAFQNMPLSTGVISAIQFYVTGINSYGDNALSINFYVFDSDGTTLLAAPQWISTDGTTGLKTIPLNIPIGIENKPYWIAMEILRGVDNMPDGALDIEVLGRYQDLQDYQTGLVLWKSLEYTESNNPNIESSGLTNIPARVGESRFTPWVRLV